MIKVYCSHTDCAKHYTCGGVAYCKGRLKPSRQVVFICADDFCGGDTRMTGVVGRNSLCEYLDFDKTATLTYRMLLEQADL